MLRLSKQEILLAVSPPQMHLFFTRTYSPPHNSVCLYYFPCCLTLLEIPVLISRRHHHPLFASGRYQSWPLVALWKLHAEQRLLASKVNWNKIPNLLLLLLSLSPNQLMLANFSLTVLYSYKGLLGGADYQSILGEQEGELAAEAIFGLKLAELQLLLFARDRVPEELIM